MALNVENRDTKRRHLAMVAKESGSGASLPERAETLPRGSGSRRSIFSPMPPICECGNTAQELLNAPCVIEHGGQIWACLFPCNKIVRDDGGQK